MSQTNFASNANNLKKIWAYETWSAGRDMSFFFGKSGMLGAGTADATKPIQRITELTETTGGTKVVMALVQDMVGDGVAGDRKLEGNEEALNSDTQEILTDQLRNGTKNEGVFSDQATVINYRVQAKEKLGVWVAQKLDELSFLTLSGVTGYAKNLDSSVRDPNSAFRLLKFAASVTAPTSNRQVFAGTATSTATLTVADTMTWKLIVKLRAFAIRRRIKPLKVDGMDTFIIVMSPGQARDLKNDTDYKNIVSMAGVRGVANPLFKGAFANIEGLVLYEHNKILTTQGLASGAKWGAGGLIEGAQALLLGAQAMGFAQVRDPSWVESDNTDYGNQWGMGYRVFLGFLKPVFKSVYEGNVAADFSVVSIYTASLAE